MRKCGMSWFPLPVPTCVVVNLQLEFRFKGGRVFIKKQSNAVILLPMKAPWRPLFDSLHKFSNDFMTTRDQPKIQQREDL